MDRLEEYPQAMFLLALGLVLLIGFVDYETGADISLLLFYLLPVLHATWFISHRAGIVLSLASAATWFVVNHLLIRNEAVPAVALWNTAVRLGIFLLVVYIVAIQSALRKSLLRERALARTDSLTGAFNSRAFAETATQEIHRARRNGQPFAVAYIDLDNFKTVNDTLGHSVGDEVLVKTVCVLRETTRATDTVARLGGDEFAILLPETSQSGASAMADKLQYRLLEVMKSGGWSVSASVGIALFVNPPETYDEMVRAADQLMYEAKTSGKNRVCSAVIDGSMTACARH